MARNTPSRNTRDGSRNTRGAGTRRANKPHSTVPGEGVPVRRVRNEPLDEYEASFVTARAIFGIGLGAVIGGLLGLLLALFPGVTWWMGLMIGVIVGGTAAAFIPTRIGLQDLETEARPPRATTTSSPNARKRRS